MTAGAAGPSAAGLDARSDFQGLSYQLGPNPPLPALDAALGARIEQTVGDPTHRVDGV